MDKDEAIKAMVQGYEVTITGKIVYYYRDGMFYARDEGVVRYCNVNDMTSIRPYKFFNGASDETDS